MSTLAKVILVVLAVLVAWFVFQNWFEGSSSGSRSDGKAVSSSFGPPLHRNLVRETGDS